MLRGLWMALSVKEPGEQASLREGGGVSLRRRTVDVVGGKDGEGEEAVLWAPAPRAWGKVRQTADPSAKACLLGEAHSA